MLFENLLSKIGQISYFIGSCNSSIPYTPTFTKDLLFILGCTLNSNDLIRWSSTSKTIRNVYLKEDFWRFKLGHHFEAFEYSRPGDLNYLQWFWQIEKGGNSFDDVGTLYLIQETASEKVVKKIEGLVASVEIAKDEVWMTDIGGNLSYVLAPISKFSGFTHLHQYLHNFNKRCIKQIITDGYSTLFMDNQSRVDGSDPPPFRVCKAIKRYFCYQYALYDNGDLFEHRGGMWSLHKSHVEYLCDSSGLQFFYKCEDGRWFLFSENNSHNIKCDKTILQMVYFYSTLIDKSAVAILKDNGDVEFHLMENIRNEHWLSLNTIKGYNIKSIHAANGDDDSDLYLIDNKNNLYRYSPTLTSQPIFVTSDVIQVKADANGLAILKKYGSCF